jgi:hypothetical protein
LYEIKRKFAMLMYTHIIILYNRILNVNIDFI